uniref:Uncharacterized protein n=1 Tax=Chrysotila carterae TaxID=13221 RepID=A0A7S4EWP2_CHRCT
MAALVAAMVPVGEQRLRGNPKGPMPRIDCSTALDEEQCLAALEGMREGDQMDDLLLSMDDLLDSAADRRELYRLVGVVDKARFSHPGSDLEFRFKCAAFADEPDTRGVVSVVLSATGQVASADVPAPASGPVYPAAAMAHTPDPPPKNSSDCQVEGFTSLISSAVAPVARLAATLSATAAAGPNAAPTVPPDTAESSHLSGAQDVFIGTHTSATDKVPNDILSEVTNSQAPSNPQSTARSDPAPSAPASAPAVFGPTPPRRVSLLFSSRGIGAARTSAQPLLSPPTRSLRAHRQLRAHTEGYEETTTVSLTPSSHTPARHTPKQRTPTSHVAATTIAPKRRRTARSSASMRGLFSDGSGDNGADNSGDSGDHHGGGGGGSVAPTPTKSASHMPARKKPAAHSRAEGLTHGKAHAHEAGDAGLAACIPVYSSVGSSPSAHVAIAVARVSEGFFAPIFRLARDATVIEKTSDKSSCSNHPVWLFPLSALPQRSSTGSRRFQVGPYLCPSRTPSVSCRLSKMMRAQFGLCCCFAHARRRARRHGGAHGARGRGGRAQAPAESHARRGQRRQ